MKSLLGAAFSGGAIAAPSQQIFTTTTSWVVPAGVYSISAVCIQRGTVAGETWTSVPAAKIARSGTDLVRAQNENRLGDGGGDGGMSGARSSHTVEYIDYNPWLYFIGSGGGGGAGGYNGAGGEGGRWLDSSEGGNTSHWGGENAATSSGGGGGGICGARDYASGGGGGGGLLGIGATGVGGTAWPSSATGGSGGANGGTTPYGVGSSAVGAGGLYGGAAGDQRASSAYPARGRGGACSWKNNIPVSPDETLTITVEGNGGVRVLWGGDRSFPSNADGYYPEGYWKYFRIYITAVAAGVPAIGEIELRSSVGGADITTPSSLCSASSQYDDTTTANKVVDNAGNAFASCWMVQGAGGAPPQWLSIRPSMDAVRVAELAMWPVTGYATWAPSSFVVQGSMNGAAWTDIKTFTGITGWADNTAKTFSLT